MHLGAAPVGAPARKWSKGATKHVLSFLPAVRSLTIRAGRRETLYPLANPPTPTLIASCCEGAVVGTLSPTHQPAVLQTSRSERGRADGLPPLHPVLSSLLPQFHNGEQVCSTCPLPD